VNSTKVNQTSKNSMLEDLNIKIWIFWTQWSSCSKCDKIGKKIKFGHCMISLNSKQFKYKINLIIDSLNEMISINDNGLIVFLNKLSIWYIVQ